MKAFRGLRGQLLAIVLIASLPTAGLVLWISNRERSNAIDQTRQQVERLTTLKAQTINGFLQDVRGVTVVLGNARVLKKRQWSEGKILVSDVLSQSPGFLNLGVADTKGKLIISARPLSAREDFSKHLSFVDAIRDKRFAVGNTEFLPGSGLPVLDCAYPLFGENGKISGVIFATVDLRHLRGLLASPKLPPGAVASLIDPRGRIAVRVPDTGGFTGKALPEAPLVRTALRGVAGTANLVGLDKVPRLYGYSPVLPRGEPTNLYVTIGFPEEQILADSRQTFELGLLLLAVVGLAALGLSSAISGLFILRPVSNLTAAARGVAEGDFSARSKLPRRGDEIGQLASEFDVMAASLEQRLHELQQTQTELRRLNEELEDRVRQRTSQLRAASQYARSLIEASLDPLVTISAEGKITDVNEATEFVTGKSRDELIGTDFSDYFTEPKKAREGYKKVLAEGFVRDYPLAIRHISGGVTDVLYNATLYKNEAGEAAGIFAAARDVTEQKRNEERILRLNKDLQRSASELAAANRELEAFSYSVSHDLRAPLRSIDGFSQALVEEYGEQLSEDGQRFLFRIRNAAGKMGELIDSLLMLSRLSRVDMEPKRVDLGRLSREIARELQESAPERKAEFVIKPVRARADKGLMRVVLENLLANAWKFTKNEPEARIEFGAQEQNGEKAYFVRDNGVGFDMTYSDMLFAAFQRLHSEKEFPGVGVGLTTVARIVHRHGGRVWAEGEPGKGATFYFTLGEQ